ncbi:hypothetical protein [Acinetobacter sp. ANC 4640]
MGKKFKIGFLIAVAVLALIAIISPDSDKNKAAASEQTEQKAQASEASEAAKQKEQEEFDKAAASEVAAAQLHPEDIIEFKYGTIACMSKDDLQAVTMHSLKHETTKANAYMLSNNNPDGTCVMLPPDKQFKVISAEYNNPDNQEIGVVEIVGKNVKSSKEGGWAFTVGAWKVD